MKTNDTSPVKYMAALHLQKNWLIEINWHPKSLLCWNCSLNSLTEHGPFWRLPALVQLLAGAAFLPLITCAHTLACAAVPQGSLRWAGRADYYWLMAQLQHVMQPKGLTSLYFILLKPVWRGKKMNSYEEHHQKSDMTPSKHRAKLWDDASVFN